MSHFLDPNYPQFWYLALLVGSVAVYMSLLWDAHVRRRAKARAPQVVEFGLSHFELLDHDKDGSISGNDLRWVQGNASLEKEKLKLVKHMLYELKGARIGHRVRVLIQYAPGPGGGLLPIAHAIHEINRGDLENYVDQLADKEISRPASE